MGESRDGRKQKFLPIIRSDNEIFFNPGEITVMALAVEINGMVVLDETAGRREAKNRDLRLTGTLGLLHQGLHRKWLTKTECLARVVKWRDAGFFIPRPAPGQTKYLRAENPKYPDLIPAQELMIQGVFKALIRRAKE